MAKSKNYSDEEIQRGLELLEQEKKRKERIARGEIKGGQKWSELSEEQKEQRREAGRRRNAKLALYKQKAEEAGIEVTDQEVDEYLAQ